MAQRSTISQQTWDSSKWTPHFRLLAREIPTDRLRARQALVVGLLSSAGVVGASGSTGELGGTPGAIVRAPSGTHERSTARQPGPACAYVRQLRRQRRAAQGGDVPVQKGREGVRMTGRCMQAQARCWQPQSTSISGWGRWHQRAEGLLGKERLRSLLHRPCLPQQRPSAGAPSEVHDSSSMRCSSHPCRAALSLRCRPLTC